MKKQIISFGFCVLSLCFEAQTKADKKDLLYNAYPKITELKHTKLKVSFNLETETLSGEEWLTAKPFLKPSDSLLLDAKSMLIHEVSIEKNGKKILLPHAYKNDILRIKLDKNYQPDELFTVYINYTAQPNQVKDKGERTFSDTKGLYFINPKGNIPHLPTQIWTQGETEYSSVWFPTIDKPDQKSTEEIDIIVPDKFATLSNGILKSSEKNNNGLRTDHWVMNLPHAPYLFFMGIGEFSIVEDKPWRNKVPINYYVEKEYEKEAKKIFGVTSEMIEFYSNQFHYEFPWPKYSQMVVRDFISGAMENTTAVCHAESAQQNEETLADQNYWETIIAHELAHHWFGDLVTTRNWSNLTVNESFANYSEYLWKEYKYGIDNAQYYLINKIAQYYDRPDDFSKKLIRYDYKNKEDMFDAVSYNKGGAILNMLRDYIGNKAFFEGISDFLKSNEFGSATALQIKASFEKTSHQNLDWFFNEWFFNNGHPLIEVNHSYDSKNKTLSVKITQKQASNNLFEFPLDIDIYSNGNYRREKVWVKKNTTNIFTFNLEKQPDLVNIDPRGILIMKILNDEKNPQQYLFQYQNTKDLKSRNEAIDYAIDHENNAILTLAIDDPLDDLKIKALSNINVQNLNSEDIQKVENMATHHPVNKVKAAAIWLLSNTKDKKYLPLYLNSLNIVSNSIKNASIHAIAQTEPEAILDFLLKSNPLDLTSDQLISVSSVIVHHKIEKYLPFLISNFIYYPSLSPDEKEKSQTFHQGFIWAMSLDNLPIVEKIKETLKEFIKYSNKNQHHEMVNLLNEALKIKEKLPQNNSVEKQIELLKNLKISFSK